MPTPDLRVVKGSSEGEIDAVNSWMRNQPWFQELVSQWGGHPGDDAAKKEAIVRAAQAHGVQVDEGNIEVDPTGNFNPKGHKLRNALIAAGIGAGGYFAAPYIAGALAGGGGASGAGYVGADVAGTAAAASSAAAGGAAAGGGILSSLGGLSGIANIAGKVAPILGGAAKDRAAAQTQNDVLGLQQGQLNLQNHQYELNAPAKRLSTSSRASLIKNYTPTSVEWGGPGSGLRGQTAKFTGGFNNPNLYDPDTKALADDVIHKQLLASLGNEDKLPLPQLSSAHGGSVADKLLGWGGTAASILGSLGRK